MAANTHVALLLLPMNVQSSSACSSMISKSRNIRWLKRFAAVEARSSHRAMVWRAWPVTRAVAEMLTPSTRRLATWSNSLRAQRRPLYAVPVCVLTVSPQTVQRYRQRRPHFVGNEPWPTLLRPSFPRLSHPRLAQAIPSIACIAQVYLGGNPRFSPTISEVKATDQQRPAQAPQFERKPRDVVISPCDGSAPRVSREGVRRGVRVVHDSRRVALVGRLGGSTRSRCSHRRDGRIPLSLDDRPDLVFRIAAQSVPSPVFGRQRAIVLQQAQAR